MQRLCFDTASDYFWNGSKGYLNTPEQARAQFEGYAFKFYAATAIDFDSNQVTTYESVDLFLEDVLAADELVSFNGRTCDLIVIETFAEPEQVEALWAKTHHDLKGWLGCQKLSALAQKTAPTEFVDFDARVVSLTKDFVKAGHIDWIAEKLANTFRDSYFTNLAFAAYIASGDRDNTF